MTQHARLDAERWSQFGLDEQVLMIGNEMNRISRALDREQDDAARRGYERVLRLTDLTVAGGPRKELIRELLRWREVVAALYCATATDVTAHRGAFRALLQLRAESARQIPHLLPRIRGASSVSG